MIKSFNTNGFLHNKSVVDKVEINRFRNSLIKTLKFLLKNKDLKFGNDFDNKKLNKTIIDLKKRNSEKISFIYSTLVHCSSYINLFETLKIRNIAAKILDADPNVLIIAEHQFRIDYPNDKNHILNWHQDYAFYPQDKYGENSLVCNISLHKITKDMGAVITMPKSHNEGPLKFRIKKGSKIKSGQREVIGKIKNYISTSLETNPGDTSFYHPHLIHKSGFNKSKKIRFSAIARIFNPLSKDYRHYEKRSYLL